jgi:hypothetical protein
MKYVIVLLCAAALSGCATVEPRAPPLTREDIIALAKAGEAPPAIIQKLEESRTVLMLSGSDMVRMHQAGVPQEVLDHLQRAQMEDIRRREAYAAQMYAWPYGSAWHCPWFPYRRYPFGWRAGPPWWGC